MSLQEILYEITQNGNVTHLKDLVNHHLVHELIVGVSRRHKCKLDVLKSWLCDWTLRYYEYDTSEYCEERYLNMMRKYLGRKSREIGNGQ